MEGTRNDLSDARDHARQAAAATLKAVRGALDMMIAKLDGDAHGNGDAAASPPPGARRPGETPFDDDGKQV